MNKDFFENLEKHQADFNGRLENPENVRTELVLTTGRAFVVDKVVEASDTWVQLDGLDPADEETPLSLVVPYHQIGHVAFVKRKSKGRSTGFAR